MLSIFDNIASHRPLDYLFEGKNDYLAMIQPVLAAIKPSPRGPSVADDINERYKAKIAKQWTNAIQRASVLQKADRITWYLRQVRMEFIDGWSGLMDPVRVAALRDEFAKRTGYQWDSNDFSDGDDPSSTLGVLQHYLSLPIASIRNYQFRYQTPQQVFDIFQTAEEKWQETAKRTLVDNDATVVLDFGNGWFWMDTQKAFCSLEAKAMGHCGNEPRAESGDHLLSLRKRFDFNGEIRWEPHLTFILTKEGALTEMKGRNNDKPIEKYHTMIKALLLLPIIKSIRGGGYMPGHNFSLNDLPAEDKKAIIEKKPQLASISDLIAMFGINDQVIDVINKAVDDLRLPDIYDLGEHEAIMAEYRDLTQYFNECVSAHMTGLADAINMVELSQGDFPDDEDDILSLLDNDLDIHEKINRYLNEFAGRPLTIDIAHRLGVEPDHAADALLHVMPKQITGMFEHLRTEAIAIAKSEIDTFLDRVNLAWQGGERSITEKGVVVIKASSIKELGASLDAYMYGEDDDYSDNDSDGLDDVRSSQEWGTCSEYDSAHDNDDDDLFTDKNEKLETWLPKRIKTSILDLFHDERQGELF